MSVAEASGVVAEELYSNGLAVGEVAEKYDVSVEAVTWLMRERGIGFPSRDQGDLRSSSSQLVSRSSNRMDECIRLEE